MKSRLLIIGGSGLLGGTLISYALDEYEIHATYNKNEILFDNISSTKIDLLEDRSKITQLIKTLKPDATIHTAAHPSVDLCEKNPKIADTLHIDITKDIASACKEANSKLIYLSTDAVFEGQLNKKYNESDKPNPINYYGKTKLEAEKIVLGADPRNVILRTAVIYGWHKRSRFTSWILDTLKEKRTVDPFVDQFNTPTLVDDLAKSILRVISLGICGLYHATGKTCINRYEFAVQLADLFGYDKNLIKPVTSLEKKQDAPRPISTCLDSSKLEGMINYQFSDIKNGISFMIKKSRNRI